MFIHCVLTSHFFSFSTSSQRHERVKKQTFFKGTFASVFTYEVEDGIVVSVACKYCTQIEGKKLMTEARIRGLRGKALSQIEKLGEKTFTRRHYNGTLVMAAHYISGVRVMCWMSVWRQEVQVPS